MPVDRFTKADGAASIAFVEVGRDAIRVIRVAKGPRVRSLSTEGLVLRPRGGQAGRTSMCQLVLPVGLRAIALGDGRGVGDVIHLRRWPAAPPVAPRVHLRILSAWSALTTDEARARFLVRHLIAAGPYSPDAAERLLADAAIRTRVGPAERAALIDAAPNDFLAARVLARMHEPRAVPALLEHAANRTLRVRALRALERLTNHRVARSTDPVADWRRWWAANRGIGRAAMLRAGFGQRGVRVQLEDGGSLLAVTTQADELSRLVAADLCEDLRPAPRDRAAFLHRYDYAGRREPGAQVRRCVD